MLKAVSMPYGTPPNSGLLKRVWDMGHRSVARHGMVSFLIEDVSVSFLTQISRHPHINLTVKSSRYCDMSEQKFVVPPFIKDDGDWEEYVDDAQEIMDIYKKWECKEGYERDERRLIAKLFLPKCSTVDLVLSGNHQAMYEMLEHRVCDRAEWEIREVAEEILRQCKIILPEIYDSFNPCQHCREKCKK
jgi:thymidylate synthase (FAD)